MHTCEFCGSVIPPDVNFCGQCGRVPYKSMETQTIAIDSHLPEIQDMDTAKIASATGIIKPDPISNQQSFISNAPTTSLSQEEEKERRRRAAILGMGVTFLGNLAIEDLPNAGSVPMVQGTPQIGSVPTVQGSPQSHAGSIGQELYSNPTIMAPQLPSSKPIAPLPATSTVLRHPHRHPHHPHHANLHHGPHGCSLILIIAAITIPILIILSILSLGLIVLAPSLSLSGSTVVVQGGTFTLQGNHFMPGGSVSLTLDDTIPLYFSDRSVPAHSTNTAMPFLSIDMQLVKQLSSSNNTVSANGDGTFSVTLTANSAWPIGKHTIKASETLTHRSADLDFTMYLAGTTPTPPTTGTVSPTVSTTPTPTTSFTPTTTNTLPGLSCVNPSSLTLGPISQGYNQPVSAQVTLCTTGSGTENWTATWDQNVAPWLQLDHTSGQILAPGQVQVKVSALAPNLAPGSYTVTLTFTSQPDNTTKSLSISFTVQAGCATGNPNKLNFNGIANISDPKAQIVTISNCGPPGTVSASTQTNNGGNWLYAGPIVNTLTTGASSNFTITSSNLKAQLAVGTYTGNVSFKIGSGTFSINVSLTVMPAPAFSGRPTLIFANRQCKPDQAGGLWVCYVSLVNSSTNLSLNWSASSRINAVNFNPSRGTMQPGQTITVQITVALNVCPTKGTLSFTGPANTFTVEWYCITG